MNAKISCSSVVPQRCVAIELARPAHFLRAGAARGGEDATRMPTGGALLKRRLLRALGWTVVPVPHHAWHDGPGDEAAEARQRLMAKLLLDAIDRRAAGAAGRQQEPPG